MDRTLPIQAPAAAAEVDVGSTLGSFELVAPLGKGAMGRVFRARHVRLGREVAIKVLNPEFVARPDVVQRFFREARVVNDIDHEHIVEVTDFVESPGLAYLVMELLDGLSLRDLMKQKGRKYPPLRRTLGIMAQLCEALEAAHDKGVVHRDLKPDNVFVVDRGGADFVKVLDFGVAKLRDSVDDMETSAGVILGTPLYMSPEQALGRGIDRRTDVWSAGVVLYELLAGAVPFTAPSFVELATRIREQPPKPLPARTPRRERVPPWLAAVAMRCLEKHPEDRFRSMAALGEALRARAQPRRGARSVRLVAASATALVAAGAVALGLGAHRRALDAVENAWRTFESPGTARRGPASGGPAAQKELAAPSTPAAPATGRYAAPGSAAPQAGPPAPKTSTPRGATPARHAAAAAPARPTTVELLVRSTPAGASIVRLDTGQRLGKTPLRVNVPRRAANVWLKLTLNGYAPVRFLVDLRRDNAANVALHGATRRARRH